MHVERKKLNKRQRRRNRRMRVVTVEQMTSKPSTDEFQVARWIKTYFQFKTAKFLNTQVQFFHATHLIDRLLETGFAIGDCALFTNREEAGDFLHLMLAHEFFHRAKKPDPNADNWKCKKHQETCLEWHRDQTFIDNPAEVYVWAYEPLYLGNWATLLLLYFSLASFYIVHDWPVDVEKNSRIIFLVACTLFFIYMIMTLLRLALYYLVRWCTNQNYEFLILPNLCKIVPFYKALWPLCHLKYIGSRNITSNQSNYSFFNIFDFYRVSLGAYVILLVVHALFSLYILYIFLYEKIERDGINIF